MKLDDLFEQEDIIITDWHYAAAEKDEYKSLDIWKDAGFDFSEKLR